MKWRHLCPWASKSVQHSFTEICRHRGPGADGKVKWCQLSISFNADSTSASAVSVTLFASSAHSSMESGNIRVLDRLLLEFGVMPILPPAQQERIDVKSPHSILIPTNQTLLGCPPIRKTCHLIKNCRFGNLLPFFLRLICNSCICRFCHSKEQYVTHF